MIVNEPHKTNEKCEILRGAIEHRATWYALLIEAAVKGGLDPEFAREAITKCGQFHGKNKYTATEDLQEFSKEFANPGVVDAFEMEIKENDGEKLSIDFHYCPLLAAWKKLGIPDEQLPLLCDMAMDGDRGIISQFDRFNFNLGKTIAKGDDVCEIRITKD